MFCIALLINLLLKNFFFYFLGHCTEYNLDVNKIQQNFRTNCTQFTPNPCPSWYYSYEAYRCKLFQKIVNVKLAQYFYSLLLPNTIRWLFCHQYIKTEVIKCYFSELAYIDHVYTVLLTFCLSNGYWFLACCLTLFYLYLTWLIWMTE